MTLNVWFGATHFNMDEEYAKELVSNIDYVGKMMNDLIKIAPNRYHFAAEKKQSKANDISRKNFTCRRFDRLNKMMIMAQDLIIKHDQKKDLKSMYKKLFNISKNYLDTYSPNYITDCAN